MNSSITTDDIVQKATLASLKGHEVSRVLTEPASDSEGREALHVTIVIGEEARISGDSALDTIVRIRKDLEGSGDERFPIVDFVTERELGSDADSEF